MSVHHCPTGAHPQPHYCCYSRHCHCDGCTALAVADNRRRRRDRAYGRPTSRYTDPASARAILTALIEAGSTRQWVQEQTGLCPWTQTRIRTGKSTKVYRSTVDKLRALWTAVGSGEVIAPRAREVAEERRLAEASRCVTRGCPRRRNGQHRHCKTCQRSQEVEAA